MLHGPLNVKPCYAVCASWPDASVSHCMNILAELVRQVTYTFLKGKY